MCFIQKAKDKKGINHALNIFTLKYWHWDIFLIMSSLLGKAILCSLLMSWWSWGAEQIFRPIAFACPEWIRRLGPYVIQLRSIHQEYTIYWCIVWLELDLCDIYTGWFFFTGSALKVLSVEDGKIPTKKVKVGVKTSHILCDIPLLSLFC